mgnify:CR=1 FL=1|tara:strand:- start:7781 stop:8470 length:690 start_codon:yes stop_codon:yes gene_type:complete
MNVHPTDLHELKVSTLHGRIIGVFFVLLVIEWGMLFYNQSWLSLFLVTSILAILFAPVIFRKRMQMEIPAEMHIIAVVFVFSALYLGEVLDFYNRLWWWDIGLHTSAGLLMGIFGFLLVYVLNESKKAHMNMAPSFIALFAFAFGVTIGSIWEIFEFSVDQLLGANMQKPMLGDPSGLTDTMWDIIVNAIGAFTISFIGFGYLKSGKSFFVKEMIKSFINKNPRMFKKD